MAGIPEDPVAEIHDLTRALGPVHLIALGIGAIIGAGIFVLTGHAAASYAGSGVVISFAIAGLGCLFAGLCYAEYAAMIPVAGSAYTYTYATMGRFLAWIIGWNLVLEYLAAGSTVAVGWSGYFTDFMTRQLHMPVPLAFAGAPFRMEGLHQFVMTGDYFNLPAVALVALVTFVLIVGVNMSRELQQSDGRDQALHRAAGDLRRVARISFQRTTYRFIPKNTGTFGQFGWSGVFRATGVIFFAYIGFDAVSVAAQEARNPQRDIPIGILGSLLLCTVLYMLMSYVLTGIASYTTLNVDASGFAGGGSHSGNGVARAVRQFRRHRRPCLGRAGAAARPIAHLLRHGEGRHGPAAVQRDASRASKRLGAAAIVTGFFCAVLAGVLPLDILGELVSIGTLAGLRDRLCRRHGAAHPPPECEASVPHAVRVDRGPRRHRHVRRS